MASCIVKSLSLKAMDCYLMITITCWHVDYAQTVSAVIVVQLRSRSHREMEGKTKFAEEELAITNEKKTIK